MKFWTFFDPHADTAPDVDRAKDIVVVKEGIAWWAFVMPLIWLAWHRLWWELLIAFVLFMVVGIAVSAMPLAPVAFMAINVLMNVAVALIGNDLRCAKLERKGYKAVAVLAGKTQLAAEAVFFDLWLRADAQQRNPVLEEKTPVEPLGSVEMA